jgi:hypothetical protein
MPTSLLSALVHLVRVPPPQDLSPLRLDRFDPVMLSEERLRAACLWQYAHHYSAEQAPT